jgi:hypothetical protein
MLKAIVFLAASALLMFPASAHADSFWNHNGSQMRLTASGQQRTITYELPRSGIAAQGVRPGTVLFEGTLTEGSVGDYSGTAYVFSARCGRMAYEVSGELQNDGTQIALSGQAPRRDQSTCETRGYRDDNLIFEFVRSEEPRAEFPPMAVGEICQIYDALEYQSCLEENANAICRHREEFEDLVRCFREAVREVYRKSLMEGAASAIVETPFTTCHRGVCSMEGGGPSPYCVRLSAQLVRECDGDVVNERCVEVECPLRGCRKICGRPEE